MAGYRPPYSLNEQRAIIEYIKTKRAYTRLRGRKFWVDMEKDKVVDRTWQSLKEHFLKKVLPNLHMAKYRLDRTTMLLFREGYIGTASERRERKEESTDKEESQSSDSDVDCTIIEDSDEEAAGPKSKKKRC